MAQHQKRYTAQQWSDLILEQHTFWASVDIICARKRIGTSTFIKWRCRFQDERKMSTQIAATHSPDFVEAVSPSGAVVSLVLGRGVRLLSAVLGSLAPYRAAIAYHSVQ